MPVGGVRCAFLMERVDLEEASAPTVSAAEDHLTARSLTHRALGCGATVTASWHSRGEAILLQPGPGMVLRQLLPHTSFTA